MRNILIAMALVLLGAMMAHAEYYAVIITGDDPALSAQGDKTWNGGAGDPNGYDEFWNDTFLMWETLFTFGWRDENIYVLYANGEDTIFNNPRYQPETYALWDIEHITDDSAYVNDVEDVFNDLAATMTDEDYLFVFTFDHGGSAGNNVSSILLMDGQMWDYEFADLVDQCAYRLRAFYMQQCYSGGFIGDLENDSTLILTATSGSSIAGRATDTNPDDSDSLENEFYEPDSDYYHHGEFDYHMFNASHLHTIIGNPLPEPDVNEDGLASMSETYDWVLETDDLWCDRIQWSDPGDHGDIACLNIPPYTPTGLTVERVNNSAFLSWNPNEEFDLDHYEIYKRTYEDSSQTYTEWYHLDQTDDTSYTDPEFVPTSQGSDTVWYRIAAVDSAGRLSDYSEVVTGPGEIRTQGRSLSNDMPCGSPDFRIENYPNPANPRTSITYTLPEVAFTSLIIYDVSGRPVASLIQDWQPAGSHSAVFDGSELSSGIYLARLTARGFSQMQKLVLLK